jgi:polysaccharide pyruvyl transferase WcaK-like protein
MVHIGDEAMFDEFVVQARARGIADVTAISSNPTDSVARYATDAVLPIGFAGPRDAMVARRELVLRAAHGDVAALGSDDPALALIAAIAAADGVAIAGGGNMSSTWPMHIFERSTIGEIARITGTPLVISGQTIGPFLTDDDAALVTELLSTAKLVGLRESASLALCRDLGVPEELLTGTIDDASFLAGAGSIRDPDYCLVTLSTHVGDEDRDAFIARTAELLDSIAADTGLAIVFSPHFGSLLEGDVRGDSVLHGRVAAAMSTDSVEIAATDAAASASLAHHASLVVTSRYHPAVFAVAAGVPTLGISVDEYTSVKLTGALGNFGQSAVLPSTGLIAGDGPALAHTVWESRDAIRASASALLPSRQAASAEWWDRVAALLQ